MNNKFMWAVTAFALCYISNTVGEVVVSVVIAIIG